MAVTTDCAEGRHEVCRGAGPNHYVPQTAHLGDQLCRCSCHCICDRDTRINDPGMTVPGCPAHDSSATLAQHGKRGRE